MSTGVHVGAGVRMGTGVYAWMGALLCKAGKGLSGVLSHSKPAQLISLQRARSMFPALRPQCDLGRPAGA